MVFFNLSTITCLRLKKQHACFTVHLQWNELVKAIAFLLLCWILLHNLELIRHLNLFILNPIALWRSMKFYSWVSVIFGGFFWSLSLLIVCGKRLCGHVLCSWTSSGPEIKKESGAKATGPWLSAARDFNISASEKKSKVNIAPIQGEQWQFSSHSQYLQRHLVLFDVSCSGSVVVQFRVFICSAAWTRNVNPWACVSPRVDEGHSMSGPKAACCHSPTGTLHPQASRVPSDHRVGPLRCPKNKCGLQRAAALTTQSGAETLPELTLELWPNVWINDLLGPPAATTSISANLHHLNQLQPNYVITKHFQGTFVHFTNTLNLTP